MEEEIKVVSDATPEIVAEEVSETIEESNEKVLEKEVKKNTKKTKQATLTKECPVLKYNKFMHFMIISFDGFGIRIDEINEEPGETVTVKYSGEISTPTFKIEVK